MPRMGVCSDRASRGRFLRQQKALAPPQVRYPQFFCMTPRPGGWPWVGAVPSGTNANTRRRNMSQLVSITTKTRYLKSGAVHTARFVRRCGRFCETIYAEFDPDYGWRQWGAPLPILGENVPSVEAW